ncbi:MAG: tetratricopeptide repeat protein [Nitrospira sp. CR1.3]|nr:tetratricopeptide repeat protein [Nitrospira sp. CR1.3]
MVRVLLLFPAFGVTAAMFEFKPSDGRSSGTHQDQPVEAAEWYERGLTLRKAGLFRQAIEQFEKAVTDSDYALKAYAQIGLCCKSSRNYEGAVTAFRNALKSPAASTKETVQILYVLGRTLESLGRIEEALEAYRWLRREDGQFRDAAERIEFLSTRRMPVNSRQVRGGSLWTQPASRVWQDLLRNTK